MATTEAPLHNRQSNGAPSRVRGFVEIQRDRCKGCRLCVDACPQHVLRLSPEFNARGYHPVLLLEAGATCTGCAICALVCPDSVFTVYREGQRLRHSAGLPAAQQE